MSSMQAYRKAALRISPKLSPSALTKLDVTMEKSRTGAPDSAFSIPQSVMGDAFVLKSSDGTASNPYADDREKPRESDPGAVVRTMGTSRRVFLINPSLTPTEIDGLAYRIRTMASNGAINSIVVGNPLEDAECDGDMSENLTCLPSFLEEDDPGKSIKISNGPYGRRTNFIKSVLHEEFGEGLGMPYVSSGYDARKIYDEGMHQDEHLLDQKLMDPLTSLSRAVRGSYDETLSSSPSKVPLVSLPNGLVTDAGYSLLMGSYVLASHSTSFRILNPLRGLAFDPVGLSYLLPRIGYEFNQASSEHALACAMILALGGHEANPEDMVATGLATHYIGGPYKLNLLERTLSDLNSWEYQKLFPSPPKMYGKEDQAGEDPNDNFKNVVVANAIQHLSEYDAAGAGEYGIYLKDELDETGLFLKEKDDPSLTMKEERIQMYGELNSELVNWGATFGDAFKEPTVEGIMENLRQIAATKAEFEGRAGCEEDVMVAEQAQMFVSNMEKRSPLALCVMHRLLLQGNREEETLESCMEREKASQLKLFTKANGDFARWGESGAGVGLTDMSQGDKSLIKDKEDVFDGWVHSSVKEVTRDEIAEIVGGDPLKTGATRTRVSRR